MSMAVHNSPTVLPTDEQTPEQSGSIWSQLIPEAKKKEGVDLPPPYVHPLLKRSSSFLNKESLEVCTESLGSETGSDGYSGLDHYDLSSLGSEPQDLDYPPFDGSELDLQGGHEEEGKGLAVVNYHCSINMGSPPRSFPPPLPSISRRDGPCFNMRTHRRDGRLVVQAVPVPSQNYLHCERQDGRIVLSFIKAAFEEIYPEIEQDSFGVQNTQEALEQEGEDEGSIDEIMEEDKGGRGGEGRGGVEGKEVVEGGEEEKDEEEEEEEEEEVVEVVDRGIVVEVKVRRQQPQVPYWGVGKVHRSFLVINKFVSGIPVNVEKEEDQEVKKMEEERKEKLNHLKEGFVEMNKWGIGGKSTGKKEMVVEGKRMFVTSKGVVRRHDLLHQVRRCSESQSPLFIWEPICIATS